MCLGVRLVLGMHIFCYWNVHKYILAAEEVGVVTQCLAVDIGAARERDVCTSRTLIARAIMKGKCQDGTAPPIRSSPHSRLDDCTRSCTVAEL